MGAATCRLRPALNSDGRAAFPLTTGTEPAGSARASGWKPRIDSARVGADDLRRVLEEHEAGAGVDGRGEGRKEVPGGVRRRAPGDRLVCPRHEPSLLQQ